jgi:energy-coupling factor transport system ATP-binding protein
MADRPPPPLLRVSGLVFRWSNGQPALDHCDLEISKPGLWMLVGSNGSGKSTLLRLISSLLQADGGTVDTLLKPALVFQNPDHQLLLPSCGSDLQLWLPPGLDAATSRARVTQALAQVGLAGLEDRPIHTLSGGQKQRLAIAGALASGASLLLLDEPTALLDETSQREVLQLIHALSHRPQQPITALWITHRLEELDWCDGAALMQNGRTGPWRSGASLQGQLRPLAHGKG